MPLHRSDVHGRSRFSLAGFTLIELLAVIGLIALLAVFLVPAASRFIDRAKGATCLARLNNVGRMTLAYAQDYRGNFPIMWLNRGRTYNFPHPPGRPGRGGPQGSYNLIWYRALGENGYAESENDYTWAYCPSLKLDAVSKRGWPVAPNHTYGINADYEYVPFNNLTHQGPAVPFYADAGEIVPNGTASDYWFQYNRKRSANESMLWARHGGVCNVWFTDGRAEAVPENAIFERLPGAVHFRSYDNKTVSR